MKGNHARDEDTAMNQKGIRQEGADCIHFAVDKDMRRTLTNIATSRRFPRKAGTILNSWKTNPSFSMFR
jgi:hypothetical protein